MNIREQLATNGQLIAFFEAESMTSDDRVAFIESLEASIAEHALLTMLESLTPEKRSELLKIRKSDNDQEKLLEALKGDIQTYKEAFSQAIKKEVAELAF